MWTASSSSSSLDNSRKPGPPYPPEDAGLGGIPTNSVDTPISAVILALFIGSAVLHMTIFQRNRRRGHKFVLSGLLFGLSMARIAANVMRIAWANYPRSTEIAIAATIFANTGVVLAFIVNLALARRIVRAHHGKFASRRGPLVVFNALYAVIVALLVMLVISTVYSFYTLDPRKRSQLRDVQLFASASLAVLSFLPIPVVLASVLVPSKHPVGQLGTKGGMRTNVALVLLTSSILALGASFRASVAFQLRPASRPAWFDSKACYYCFIYVVELVVVYLYALSRFDQRFHVPDGSGLPGCSPSTASREDPRDLLTRKERAACQAQTATPEKGKACVT